MLYWSKIIEENWILSSGIRILIFFMNLMNKIRKWHKKGNNSIAIISFHKLGDSVFTIPTIEKIIGNTDHEISLFCMEDSVPLYNLVFGDSINYFSFTYQDFWFGGRISKSRIRECFKQRNASIIIDITGSPQSVSTIISNRADNIIGFNQRVFKSLYTIFNTIDDIKHISEIYAKAVKGFIEIDTDSLLKRFKIERKKTGAILIHPFAGWAAKEWGIQRFILLARKLNEIRATQFVIPVNSVAQDVKEEIDLSGIKIIETKTINELINNLKDAFLVIGNDSGIIYIANLLNIPTFTLFGPSNPSYHYVPSENSGFINEIIPCSPIDNNKLCFTNGGRDGCPANICMDRINPDVVYKRIKELVSHNEL